MATTETLAAARKERREQVRCLSGNGFSQQEIADQIGTSKRSVRRDLWHLGIIQTRTMIVERRELVAKLVAEGCSTKHIAQQLDVAINIVRRDRVILGIPCRAKPPLTAQEITRAELLLADGCSYAEVGRTLGRDAGNIAHRFPGKSKYRGNPMASCHKLREQLGLI